MKFTVTSYARQINVLASGQDEALQVGAEILGLSYSETFYAEVTDGFTEGVAVINAIS